VLATVGSLVLAPRRQRTVDVQTDISEPAPAGHTTVPAARRPSPAPIALVRPTMLSGGQRAPAASRVGAWS
jgi:hypothetical protein